MTYSTGSSSGSVILTDDDDLYPAHINELRQSNPSSFVVGLTSGSQYYCDGTKDDVQIQEALDDCNTAGGGTVWLKKGTYQISARLRIYSNTTLCGEGWQSILKSADNVNVGCIWGNTIDNVIIKDLAIDMNRTNNTTLTASHGIYYQTATNSMVDNVYVHDMRYVAGQGNVGIASDDCINCVWSNNYIDTIGDYGFSLNGLLRSKVINNYVKDASSHGIAILGGDYGTDYSRCNYNIISGNTVYFTTSTVKQGSGIKVDTIDYCEVTNNTLYHTGVGYIGINFQGENADRATANENYFVNDNFSGNVIYGFSIGISANAMVGGKISGNVIHFPSVSGGRGLSLGSGGTNNDIEVPSTRVIISNNYIEEAANLVAVGLGMWILQGSNHITITGNTIYNTSNVSIGVGQATYTSNYIKIIGNSIIDSGTTGLELQNSYHVVCNNIIRGSSRNANNTDKDILLASTSTYCVVTGNNCIADGSNKSAYGLYENIGGDYNNIFGNTFTGQVTAKIGINGTNTKIRNNIGYVTEASGTTTIGGTATVATVTHGLSVTPTGDDIMVTPMTTMGSASWYYTSTYGTASFNINTNIAPVGTVTFGWKAIVL